MGCTNEKMVKVAPQTNIEESSPKVHQSTLKEEPKENIPNNHRAISATSKASKHSIDSAFIDGEDGGSTRASSATTVRTSSGGLKRTLRNLSAKSNRPREDEEDILKKLRSEGFLASDTHKAKNGLSFELIDQSSQPRKLPPARLAKLEKRQKKRKLLTQQDIEAKLEKAEIRRKEAEAERLEKIQSVTVKSNINDVLDTFIEHQKQVKQVVQEKVDTATENRAKKFREMREKLRAKEEHAALVRQRKKTLGPIKIEDGTAEQVTSNEQ